MTVVSLSLCIKIRIALNLFMHTSFVAIPGAPQNVSAQEISECIDNNCIILVTWDPPANTDQSDIVQYIVNVTSRNISVDTVSSTIYVLRVPDCCDEVCIQVAAVNRFDCVGLTSSEVRPSLLDIVLIDTPTEGGSATIPSK